VIKRIIKKFLDIHYLAPPSFFKFLLRYFFYETKPNISSFPLTPKKKSYFEQGMKFKGQIYYSKIYSDSRNFFNIISKEDYLKIPAEILPGSYHKNLYHASYDEPCLIAFCPNKENKIEVNLTNQEGKVNSFSIKQNYRFNWFKVNKNSKLEAKSQNGFIAGKEIFLTQKSKTKRDLVLMIFIDGLADIETLNKKRFKDIMPNTSHYFSNSYEFRTHFSNAEWTLPSVPCFTSGLYTQNHGLFHPSKKGSLSEYFLTLSEIFNENGYLTSSIGGNWRISPPYGYTRGVDRSIYRNSMTHNEVIDYFIEHNSTFSARSQFCFLTFMDLHHDLNVLPEINTLIDCSQSVFAEESNKKSVFLDKDDGRKALYLSRIKNLDRKLQRLFEYISTSYASDNITISLVTDHGQSYLSHDSGVLSEARIHIPWFFKSPEITTKKKILEPTENVDIFNTIVHDSILDPKKYLTKNDGVLPKVFGGNGRSFAFSQSIYPNRKYVAKCSNSETTYLFESDSNISEDGKLKISSKEVKNIKLLSGKHDQSLLDRFFEKIISLNKV